MELGGHPKFTMVPVGKYSMLPSLAAASVALHSIDQSRVVFLSHLNLDHVSGINHAIYWIAKNQPIHCNFILGLGRKKNILVSGFPTDP